METNWAADHLQTIRTLMERSAVYRRALAPIMLFAGIVGTATAVLGVCLHLDLSRQFCGLWLGAAVVTVAGAFLLVRRQALKDSEPLWSPPTRRVTQAAVPPLFAGLCLGAFTLFVPNWGVLNFVSTLIWIVFYGCALNAAGFFMPRGMKIFGWIFILGGCGIFYGVLADWISLDFSTHWLMGFFFGVLHLAYGAYLFLTEKGKNAA